MAVESLYEARGFKAGICYQHPAKRHCDYEKGKFSCSLELFPGRTSALSIPLAPQDALIANKKTLDFGIFKFKVKSYKNQVPKIQIMNIERIKLKDWDGTQDKMPLAKSVDC